MLVHVEIFVRLPREDIRNFLEIIPKSIDYTIETLPDNDVSVYG